MLHGIMLMQKKTYKLNTLWKLIILSLCQQQPHLLKGAIGISDNMSGYCISVGRVKGKIMTFFWEQAIILHHLPGIWQMNVDVGFPKAIQQKQASLMLWKCKTKKVWKKTVTICSSLGKAFWLWGKKVRRISFILNQSFSTIFEKLLLLKVISHS